jgi:hypothetical protein
VGNPPYLALRAADYRPGESATEPCPNVYAWVVERSLQVLAPLGRLGMILPVSAVSGSEYRPLAELYLRRSCWISTYSNRPGKLFEGVEQRLAILLAANTHEPQHWMSPYQHWYAEERGELFERIRYAPARLWEGVPAKTGTDPANRIFDCITGVGAPLVEALPAGDGAGVWLHDGPTYWVRALPFPPNEGLPEARSGHYRRIPVPDQHWAYALSALLSSSTFYFFFKATSNCRDLGRREWERFPAGRIESVLGELSGLGERLADRLRETASRRRRKYPSGEVVYEEYYPARAKEILDEIDSVLAVHYGFTPAELGYVTGLDLKYRMGKNADAG